MMKTFEDLRFEPHPHAVHLKQFYAGQTNVDPYIEDMFNGAKAWMEFPNGYEISVLCGVQFYSTGRDTYEVGVFYQGMDTQFFPTGSVAGWQTRDEVEEIMKDVQELKD